MSVFSEEIMIDISTKDLTHATLVRLKVSAIRANRTVRGAFARLRELDPSKEMAAWVIGARLGDIDQAYVGRARLFTSVSKEVAERTALVADELLFLCSLTVSVGLAGGHLRRQLAAALEQTSVREGSLVNLRQQRIRRLPINEALECVLNTLDQICDQIDALLLTLAESKCDVMRDSPVQSSR
nr:hypothetical protein [uncultured Dongia sp.]